MDILLKITLPNNLKIYLCIQNNVCSENLSLHFVEDVLKYIDASFGVSSPLHYWDMGVKTCNGHIWPYLALPPLKS